MRALKVIAVTYVVGLVVFLVGAPSLVMVDWARGGTMPCWVVWYEGKVLGIGTSHACRVTKGHRK